MRKPRLTVSNWKEIYECARRSMKYISKIQSGSTNCYFVRVPSVIKGKILYGRKPVNKSFPKGSGTWKKALQKAIKWRDKYLSDNSLIELLDKRRRDFGPMRDTGRGKSGIIGVHKGLWTKPNSTHEYWCAIFSHEATHKRQSFAVGRYGHVQAFRMACIKRFKECGTLIITDLRKLPAKPPVDYYVKPSKRLHKCCPPEIDQATYDKLSSEDVLDSLLSPP